MYESSKQNCHPDNYIKYHDGFHGNDLEKWLNPVFLHVLWKIFGKIYETTLGSTLRRLQENI